MRRVFAALLFVCLFSLPSFATRQRISGWCEQGGYSVTVPGTAGSGSQRFQQSYRSCSVTIYLVGTNTLATLYSDDAGTAQANPFTASSTGYWFAYIDGGRFDVRFSGGGISTPFTLGDFRVDNAAFDITDFGAKCDGTTNDYAAIDRARAAATAQTNGGTVLIPSNVSGSCLLNSSITFDSDVTLAFEGGGRISMAAATTATINGSISAPTNSQIFAGSGGFVINNTPEVYASWFAGADAGAMINAGVTSLPSTGGTVNALGLTGAQSATATITLDKPVALLLGGITLTTSAGTAITMTSSGASIKGIDRVATTITHTGTSWTIKTAEPTQAGGVDPQNRIENLSIDISGGQPAGGILISPATDNTSNNNFIGNVAITGAGSSTTQIGVRISNAGNGQAWGNLIDGVWGQSLFKIVEITSNNGSGSCSGVNACPNENNIRHVRGKQIAYIVDIDAGNGNTVDWMWGDECGGAGSIPCLRINSDSNYIFGMIADTISAGGTGVLLTATADNNLLFGMDASLTDNGTGNSYFYNESGSVFGFTRDINGLDLGNIINIPMLAVTRTPTQTVGAAFTITANTSTTGLTIFLTATTDRTSASPGITDGYYAGQWMMIQNVGTALITIQRTAGQVEFAGLRDCTLGANDTVFLIWDATRSTWFERGRKYLSRSGIVSATNATITRGIVSGDDLNVEIINDAVGLASNGVALYMNLRDTSSAASVGGAIIVRSQSPTATTPDTNMVIRNGDNTDAITISAAQAVRFNSYGAGTATFDGSGNITSVSDERLKNIQGGFTSGLADLVKLNPILYKWKPESGLDTEGTYAGFSAQDVQAAIPSAVTLGPSEKISYRRDADGREVEVKTAVTPYYGLQDRALIAALVNAIKELKAEIDVLKAKIQ